jgi:hypothetical protein
VPDEPAKKVVGEPPVFSESSQPARPQRTVGYWLLMALHWIIIVNFIIEVFYAGYMVFVVMAPADGAGPLWQRATAMPFEQMATRRLYAIECWIAIAGLAIYLAITEIGPRFKRLRGG